MKDKNKLIKRISQVVGFTALIVSVIFAVMFYLGINDEATLASNVNLMIGWAVILTIAVVVVAFLFGPIMSTLSNPQSLVKGLISLGVLAIVFIIAYTMSKGDITTVHLAHPDKITNLKGKLVFTETGIYAFYIFAALGVLGVLVAEIKSLLKL